MSISFSLRLIHESQSSKRPCSEHIPSATASSIVDMCNCMSVAYVSCCSEPAARRAPGLAHGGRETAVLQHHPLPTWEIQSDQAVRAEGAHIAPASVTGNSREGRGLSERERADSHETYTFLTNLSMTNSLQDSKAGQDSYYPQTNFHNPISVSQKKITKWTNLVSVDCGNVHLKHACVRVY